MAARSVWTTCIFLLGRMMLPDLETGAEWETEPAAAAIADTASLHAFEVFSAPTADKAVHNSMDVILDVPVRLTVELGRSKITVRSMLQIAKGSVIELDGLAGEPMDVLINDCLIAQGEVVVVNDKFGIRLTDITNPAERIRSLKR